VLGKDPLLAAEEWLNKHRKVKAVGGKLPVSCIGTGKERGTPKLFAAETGPEQWPDSFPGAHLRKGSEEAKELQRGKHRQPSATRKAIPASAHDGSAATHSTPHGTVSGEETDDDEDQALLSQIRRGEEEEEEEETKEKEKKKAKKKEEKKKPTKRSPAKDQWPPMSSAAAAAALVSCSSSSCAVARSSSSPPVTWDDLRSIGGVLSCLASHGTRIGVHFRVEQDALPSRAVITNTGWVVMKDIQNLL
jgi:hypothetical protein